MTADSAGYGADVAYLRTFSRNLAPPRLRAVAALNGFAPPPAEEFDYCELGAGNGDTTATLAAAHPRARFVGVDVMPEHVAFASGLARRGGLGNVTFLERDFEDLVASDLPPFDFITAHGVLSWVSPAKRRALVAFAEAKLKQGGLLLVSYNALPGWAAVEPLRRLIAEGPGGDGVDTLERARRGVALARMLADAKAGYFAQNPVAATMLESMTRTGLSYVVHEYLQPHWHPLYVADVAREMAAGGLYYIGQLPLHQNFADLSLPPALVELFKGVNDRIVFESLKDYALNEAFRRDVYIKGTAAHSAAETQAFLDTTPFGTLVAPSLIQRELRLPHYTVKFSGPVFDALLPALAEQPASAAELACQPALAPFGLQRIRDALVRLLLGEDVAPMHPATPPLSPAFKGHCRVPSAYNRMILEQDLGPESTVVLAAPAAGTGIVVEGTELTALRALTGIAPGRKDERIPAEEVERVRAHALPKLVQLGVLEKA
jgi:hypothetical protein